MVNCPICDRPVKESDINNHIDSNCKILLDQSTSFSSSSQPQNASQQKPIQVANFFKPPSAKKPPVPATSLTPQSPSFKRETNGAQTDTVFPLNASVKRTSESQDDGFSQATGAEVNVEVEPSAKRLKSNSVFQRVAPLAERMRPRTLDDVYGQELVGENGILRGLIETDRVPSMVLWGGPGTGKTTIARLIANMVGSRFVEINSTSSGVQECKKIFAEAKSELSLTGRKTILFCDEIHRFSKTQQDVFLGPVESGQVTLIAASTENPSFKVQNALLSRCRTFTLQKLMDEDIARILNHALEVEGPTYQPSALVDGNLITYLAAFADGDARTALNLLELAMDLSNRPEMNSERIKSALTKTLVYDRAGDQHYDTISAFHKSIRGSDADAALYYLARMIQSGEDALYIARRLIVVASEDVGLADNSMLSLATAAYTAAEKIGLPEARINLAHATVAMALSKKSTRVYRSLSNATAALKEPGIAGLPIPIHLRNAPTRLMKELGYGKEYKYNPNYKDGKVAQEYLPERLQGKSFLEKDDLGTEIDPDCQDGEEG